MGALPQHPEAEAAILGSILLRGQQALTDVLDLVQEDDFFVPAHTAVFKAMKALDGRGEPIDVVAVHSQLEMSGESKLAGLQLLNRLGDRYASVGNIVHHAGVVREAATLRLLHQECRDIAEKVLEPVEDPGAFFDDAERRVLAVNERGRASNYQSANGLLKPIFERIVERARRKNPITGVPTRFVDLDAITGGLQPGDLIIIAARPSMGKTAFVLNIAHNTCVPTAHYQLARPEERYILHPVLFFSLEMGATQLVERLLCADAKVDYSKLRAGTFQQDDFHRLIGAAERLSKAPFYLDDQAAPTILEMRARARRFRNDRTIFSGHPEQYGLIVVDYLQLARGGAAKYQSREQEISEISRGLKAMAKELHMPVVALSQLNRSVDSRADHRPQLSDLRESGAIEQDADVVAFIYREERYLTADSKPEERKKAEGKAEVIIGKQRSGPVGVVELHFSKQHTRFMSIEREDYSNATG